MFRRSKRDKERKGSSLSTESAAATDAAEQSKFGSLKRHSKLFLFGKKEKKKVDTHTNGQESPYNGDADGIRIDESFEDKPRRVSHTKTTHSITSVNEENNHASRKTYVNKLNVNHKRNSSSASRVSNAGSLSLDFGTDSMFPSSFAADVLKATEEKLKGVDLKLPEIKTKPQDHSARTVTVQRDAFGDYGFALKNSEVNSVEIGHESSNKKAMHIIEPATVQTSIGLLPGDRLVSIDGVNVENCNRDEIEKKVATAGHSVELKVVPAPEFSELSSRTAALQNLSPKLCKSNSLARSGSLSARSFQHQVAKDMKLNKSWGNKEKVWLVHQSGFSSGVLNKIKNKDGESYSCQVTLDHGGEMIDVEEEAVEKINPSHFDEVEDLSTLRYLNESGCLHTLRQRYAGNLTHTHAGNKLIIIKPKEKLAVYTEKVMQMFKGCKREDMPPHIYATAQTSYRSMFSSNVNQSIVMLGNAGSGKTFNMQQLIKYFTTVTVSSTSNSTVTKMDAVMVLLESFSQAKTKLSCNGSSCAFLYTLEFDTAGLLIGSSIQNFFLDKNRVSHINEEESSYRIFYELLDGCDGKLKQDLMLDALPREGNILFDFQQQFADKEKHTTRWEKLQNAFSTLNISPDEIRGILTPLAAILHLGAAGITTIPGAKPYFSQPLYAQRAAAILGTTEESLARVIFTTSVQLGTRSRSGSTLSRSGSTASRSSVIFSKVEESPRPDVLSPTSSLLSIDSVYDNTLAAFRAFTVGLYVEAFTALTRLVNRAVNTNGRIASVVNILDMPGFCNKSVVGLSNNLEDLRTNYCNEKLQWLMQFSTFTAPLDRYNRENIDCNYNAENVLFSDQTISILDKLPMERKLSHGDFNDVKGLFWIIEEEAVKSNSSEISLIEKIKIQHENSKGSKLVSVNPNLPDVFVISHLQNTVPVKYSVSGWLRQAREHPAMKMPYSVLSDSSKACITELYAGHQSGTFHHDVYPSRMRRKMQHTISSVRRNSISMQYKTQMDRILEILDCTALHFVYCFLAGSSDGLVDPSAISSSVDRTVLPSVGLPFLRQQFQSSYLLESMRIHRQGYPDHTNFSEFRRQFGILLSKTEHQLTNEQLLLDEKQSVLNMLEKLDLEERSYKLGVSQIFFRAGVLQQLEDRRDEGMADIVIEFQALCKGNIARQNLKRRRLQSVAIRCIQRNIRKFVLVRNWSWWRLYTKVLPLLDVHRTEQELKTKTSELTTLNNKIEKLEKENQESSEENMRLKKKIQELSSQLSQIHSSVTGDSELLEHETSERLRLEEELERAKMETERLSTQYRQLESEFCEMKLDSITNGGIHPNGDVGIDELEENDSVWREKYKALSKELENTRRKLTDQAEEEIQVLMNQKRSSEKALAEERSEADEARRQLTNTKRKLNKVNSEMDDMKLILESVQSRNAELEKKQRKFDLDMQNLIEEVEQQKLEKDTALRERDKYSTDKYALQNTVNAKDDEILQFKRKIERLNEEIEDYSGTGKENTEIVTLKRQFRELESKMQDQEEELDEQAGQIQQLEQAKLKLEMAAQRDKQQFQRDLETKDDDMEQIKLDHQRKMRGMEEQLDEEYRRREDLNKVKRDLERRVFELQNSVEDVDKSVERKLKKEIKKLRILYKDAKNALDSHQAKGNDQAELKSLRTQLEDLEFTKHMALKAKVQIEADMDELTNQLDALTNSKEAADDRCLGLSRENADLQTRIDETEDEMEDIIRNNKQLIAQVSETQNALIEMKEKCRNLEDENDNFKQKVEHLTQKIQSNQKNMIDSLEYDRLDAKCHELDAQLETENATKIKLDHQVNRLKGQLERLQDERTELLNTQSRIQQNSSRFERQAKEYKGELESVKRLESDHKRRREEAENHLQNVEEELSRKKHELTLSEKRIRELQESFEQDLAASSGDENDSYFDDVYGSDESLNSSGNRRRNPSIRRNKSGLSKRYSTDSFDNSFSSASSYRPRRSLTNDDSLVSSRGFNAIRTASIGEHRNSSIKSRTTSRTTSRTVTRQSSFE